VDPREIISGLNPVLRGWGQYFRTGNASDKFSEVDKYVVWRMRRLRWYPGSGRKRFSLMLARPIEFLNMALALGLTLLC